MFSERFRKAVNFVLAPGIEGVYSDDPEDPGNWTGGKKGEGELLGTKFGVSAASYPQLDIKSLTREQAVYIYHRDYWAKIRGDDLPPLVGLVAFDCAVNQGVDAAIKILQTCVGTEVDGIVGPNTLAATRQHEQRDLLADFLARRAVRYAKSPDFKRYGRGWMRRLFFACMEAMA